LDYSERRPQFSDELVDACEKSGDYRPMLFEWYKHVGGMTNGFASIDMRSPAFRRIPAFHYAALVGLLNRCSRLMLSNTALASNGRFGETTRLIDRCIVQTAIKVRWLCTSVTDDDRFDRYLASGLKPDLIFKQEIEQNINNRGGQQQVIEVRMLESIDRSFTLSGMSPDALAEAKGLPTARDMMASLEMDGVAYTAIQRLGSHSIHGTWTDLITHYLRVDDAGEFHLRDHDVATHHNQYVMVMLMVLHAARSFFLFMAHQPADVGEFVEYVRQMADDIVALDKMDVGTDFDTV